MALYLIRRILSLLVTVFAVVSLVFFLLRLSPGSPLYTLLGYSYSEEGRAAVAERLGLNASIPEQYARYLGRMFSGDLGQSVFSGQPVWTSLAQRVPVSLELAVLVGGVWMAIGVVAGCLAALRRGSFFDGFVRVFSVVALSVPSFWLGLACVLVFGLHHRGLPGRLRAAGAGPRTAPGLHGAAVLRPRPAAPSPWSPGRCAARCWRRWTATTCPSRPRWGRRRQRVVRKVALRNAAIPTVTVMGLMLGMLLSGAILIENVFGIPGLGQLMVDSFRRQDYPVAAGCCLAVAVLYLFTNLLVDIAQMVIDPHIKESVLSGTETS